MLHVSPSLMGNFSQLPLLNDKHKALDHMALVERGFEIFNLSDDGEES